jgi:GNAT superfamily N-acetyltransferase
VRDRRAIWARAGRLVRENGLRQLWFRLLGELGYRRQLVTELLLEGVPAPAAHAPGIDARFLGGGDLDDYAALHGNTSEARARLARGGRCFGVWVDGRLASTVWLATGTAHIDYLARDFPLVEESVYIYEMYTSPEQRGRGLSEVASAAIYPILAEEGVRRMVGVLEPENTGANRTNKRAGYRVVGRIGYLKLGPWRRDFGSLD